MSMRVHVDVGVGICALCACAYMLCVHACASVFMCVRMCTHVRLNRPPEFLTSSRHSIKLSADALVPSYLVLFIFLFPALSYWP